MLFIIWEDFNIEMTNVAPGDFATNIAAGRYHAPVLENSPYKEKYGHSLKTSFLFPSPTDCFL